MSAIKYWITGLAILAAAPAHAAAGGFLLSDSELQALRARPEQTSALMARCAREIDHSASPVAEMSPPDHYGPAGVVKPATPLKLGPDGQVAYRAALCYAISGEARFATHTQAILDAWARTLRTVGSKQGSANVNFSLPYFALAGGLVRDAGKWDDSAFRAFLRNTVLPQSASERDNNHGNWGVLLEATAGAYLADRAVLDRAYARWETLMAGAIAADGSLPLEICRSDNNNYCGGERKGVSGLSYTHYTLLPSALAAQVFERSGIPAWDSPGGAQLNKAFVRAAEWTRRPETFPYYSAQRPLIGVRNASYFPLLQRHYPNPAAAQVLAEGGIGANGFELGLLFGAVPARSQR